LDLAGRYDGHFEAIDFWDAFERQQCGKAGNTICQSREFVKFYKSDQSQNL
jgi:hypothetical protein